MADHRQRTLEVDLFIVVLPPDYRPELPRNDLAASLVEHLGTEYIERMAHWSDVLSLEGKYSWRC